MVAKTKKQKKSFNSISNRGTVIVPRKKDKNPSEISKAKCLEVKNLYHFRLDETEKRLGFKWINVKNLYNFDPYKSSKELEAKYYKVQKQLEDQYNELLKQLEDEYNDAMKAKRNAEYLAMLDKSMAEAEAGGFITKTIAELEEYE